MRRRVAWVIAVLSSLALGLAACGGGEEEDGQVTLNLYSFDEEAFRTAAQNCNEQADGWRIEFNTLPADADGQREQLVRRLAAQDSSVDLMVMDVIWTAEFAEAGWVREWTGQDREDVSEGVLDKALQSATYQGRLWAAPNNTNAQVFFYRKDLVGDEAPKTWAEAIRVGDRLREEGKPSFLEAQGAQYEGYTVWFNSLIGSAGGEIIKGDEPALGEPAVEAIQTINDLATSGAADPSLSNQMEDQTLAQFASGQAAMMVNYPSFYSQIQEENPDIFEKMGVAQYPSVEPNEPGRSTIGGSNVGVGAYTDNPREAVEAAKCLRSRENQKQGVVDRNLPTSYEDLYEDPEVLEAQPFAPLLRRSLEVATLRPVSPFYNDISLVIQKTLSPPADNGDAEGKEQQLRDEIERVLGSGGLI